mmetsp:Transcript_36815/g.59535  ORF Transcript_36815/g.59535 Transcript_36815/m.59535 type:complete len:420 (-) Transcript_36815:777-2036(-)|eukprot:CAMPEP_0184663730 /NCGR_PEP_ID=MMETSP0308-20130426/49477_1 /TAXON_ID=38269 /ORGANISM="Gloeochaete witrockiana, Strain SAG 46.84" /LENGTH=419 /DNA_ID=CAMNT_0027106675 /DNA_START=30 /DNA_END=1289 /DNA_ORIENTATION=-
MEAAFHDGEREAQRIAFGFGEQVEIERFGSKFVRDHIVEQHALFYEKLPYAFIASLDEENRPWASIMIGEPGFMRCLDEHHVQVATSISHGDPLRTNLANGGLIGMLGIEFHTRRRNRLNGKAVGVHVSRIANASGRSSVSFGIDCQQSYGNCPKYIQARFPSFLPPSRPCQSKIQQGVGPLNDRASALVQRSDTFMVASLCLEGEESDRRRGADVSHRGGPVGFVKMPNPSTLRWPDYVGNRMFMTLGNIYQNGHAGLLFIDFETGDTLQMTGKAHIDWNDKCSPGAQRHLTFHVDKWIMIDGSVPLKWSEPRAWSGFNELPAFVSPDLPLQCSDGVMTSPTQCPSCNQSCDAALDTNMKSESCICKAEVSSSSSEVELGAKDTNSSPRFGRVVLISAAVAVIGIAWYAARRSLLFAI